MEALASAFHDQDSADLVLHQIGFLRARRPPWTTAIRYWTAIAEELDKGIVSEPYRRLLEKALGLYPNNRVFYRLTGPRRDRPRPPVPPPPSATPPAAAPPVGLAATALELRGRLKAYRAKASRLGFVEDHALSDLYSAADLVLTSRPVDLRRAAMAVHAYETAVHARAEKTSGTGEEADG